MYGLKLFNVEFNDMHNGSFRAFIKWSDNKTVKFKDIVLDTINNENDSGIFNKQFYVAFMERLNMIKQNILGILREIKNNNKIIGMYSFPAKSYLVLRFFNLDSFLDFAVEDSRLKIGKFIPDTKIKIISRQEFIDNPPDYTIIGANNYAANIMKNNMDVKTQWITVLPNFRFID